MKLTLTFLSVMLVMSALLQNCSCMHRCTSPAPIAKFVNFDSADLNIVIVKSYNNNGQFTDLQHTAVYTTRRSNMYGFDTSFLDADRIFFVEYFTDYTIHIPATGHTWQLKNVSQDAAKMREQYCTGGLNYTLNDVGHTIPPNPTSSSGPTIIELTK